MSLCYMLIIGSALFPAYYLFCYQTNYQFRDARVLHHPPAAPSWSRVRLMRSSRKRPPVISCLPPRDTAPSTARGPPQPSSAWPPPPSPCCSLPLLLRSPSETGLSVPPTPPSPGPQHAAGKCTSAQTSPPSQLLWPQRSLRVQSDPKGKISQSWKISTALPAQNEPRNKSMMSPWAQNVLLNRTGWPSEALRPQSSQTWTPSWVPVCSRKGRPSPTRAWTSPWVRNSPSSAPTCPWARCSCVTSALRMNPWWVQTEGSGRARTCPWTQHQPRQPRSSWCQIPGMMNWSRICCQRSRHLSLLTRTASPGSATCPTSTRRWPSAWVRGRTAAQKSSFLCWFTFWTFGKEAGQHLWSSQILQNTFS